MRTMTRRGLTAVISGGLLATVVSDRPRAQAPNRRATLYKNPQCQCCEGYAAYLRSNGIAVTLVPTHDLSLISRENGVPPSLEGCHVTLLDGYVVVGHVPMRPVNRLLAERPSIKGISLPGMPTGTPGMGGPRTGPLTIYEIPHAEISQGVPRVYAVE